MKRLRQWRELTADERRVLVLALPLVAIIRLCLWLVPFRILRVFWSSRIPGIIKSSPTTRLPPRRIVWLVAVASRFVPTANCLPRALTAQLLLARRGYPTTLQIGVRKLGNELDAHAWLEFDGVPLFESQHHLRHFTPMTANNLSADVSRSDR